MSAVNNAGCLILRWAEPCDSAVHEHRVEVISSQQVEMVIRSPISLQEQTSVILLEIKASGIVRSCRKEGSGFIVTIASKDEINRFSSGSQGDPGVMAIDSFLTEEQEADLLKHWDH